jgi:putative inorganic carbon (HCO3(-)) transporter
VASRVAPADVAAHRLTEPPLMAGIAAATGALYALTAYTMSPALLPVLLGAVLAIGIGLWRLEWGLALFLFLVPFSENAPLSDPGAARLRLALVLWAMALVFVEGVRLARSGESVAMPPLGRAALAFLLAALLAVPVAEHLGGAASKLLMIVGSVTLFALVALRIHDWRRLETIIGAAIVAGLVVSVHALYQNFTGNVSLIGFIDASGSVEYRVTSFFSHPNQLAGFLAVLIPVAAALSGQFSHRWLRVAARLFIPLALAAILVTYSRGAIVGLLALPLLFVRDPRTWPALAVGLTVIALLSPGAWQDRIAGAGSLDSPEIASRFDIWSAAVEAFGQKPVLGWGLDDFPSAYLALERPGRNFLGQGQFDLPPTAHNLYLNTAAEQGLIGLAALAVLMVAIVRMTSRLGRAGNARDRALGRALLGVGIVLALHNLFDLTFLEPKTSMLVWTLLGVGAARAGAADT